MDNLHILLDSIKTMIWLKAVRSYHVDDGSVELVICHSQRSIHSISLFYGIFQLKFMHFMYKISSSSLFILKCCCYFPFYVNIFNRLYWVLHFHLDCLKSTYEEIFLFEKKINTQKQKIPWNKSPWNEIPSTVIIWWRLENEIRQILVE